MTDIIGRHKKALSGILNRNGVEFAYLFGSFAYQNTTPESDVDLAVYLKKEGEADFFEKRLALISEVSRELKREADIVVLNDAPIFLKYVVLREGRLIFEKNRSKRTDFELRTLNDYFDYEPTFKIYRRRLLKI